MAHNLAGALRPMVGPERPPEYGPGHYVMLWFLSGGKDGTDYTNSSQLVADLPPSMPPVEDTATAGREDDHYDVANGNVQAQIEARDRLREMAQFGGQRR